MKVCISCNNWKPERTHHCKICGVCVPKMDHHCPWIGNCVGKHNYKPFFLFCFYQMLVGVVYFSAAINRVFHGKKAEKMSVFGVAGYWFTNLVDMPICFALIGLSGSILCDIYSNMSTLENMGSDTKRYPCYGQYIDPYLQGQQTPNKYDLLWVNNMQEVLGSQIYYWLIPFYTPKNSAIQFKKLPKITNTDDLCKNEDKKIVKKDKKSK